MKLLGTTRLTTRFHKTKRRRARREQKTKKTL